MADWNWTPYVVGGAARADSFSGMDPGFNASLQQLFASAPPEIQQNLRVMSGYRSPERQGKLFADAVAKYGSESAARKWVAPPGNSKHNHGVAADLKFLDPEAITWAHENAGKFGLQFPLANENWHIEPIGSRDGGFKAQSVPQTQIAATVPAGQPQAALMAPQVAAAPGGAQTAAAPTTGSFGDVVAPTAAPDFGSVVAAYLQNRQRRDSEQEAEQTRRNALFSQVGSPFA